MFRVRNIYPIHADCLALSVHAWVNVTSYVDVHWLAPLAFRIVTVKTAVPFVPSVDQCEVPVSLKLGPVVGVHVSSTLTEQLSVVGASVPLQMAACPLESNTVSVIAPHVPPVRST